MSRLILNNKPSSRFGFVASEKDLQDKLKRYIPGRSRISKGQYYTEAERKKLIEDAFSKNHP